MPSRRQFLTTAALAMGAPAMAPLAADEPGRGDPGDPGGPLFAVEFTVGPAWDAAKPPSEQAHFGAHSANLRALREDGALVLGARHGDKGLVVLRATDEIAARAMVERDPAVAHGTFTYVLNPFAVFYGGCVASPPRR